MKKNTQKSRKLVQAILNEKITDISISAKKLSKKANSCEWDEYYDRYSHQMAPSNNQHKQRLAIELYEWATNITRPHILEDFWHMKGISVGVAWRWIAKYPELTAANQYAKERLASIRLMGAAEKNLDWGVVKYTLPLFWESAEILNDQEVARKIKAAEAIGQQPNVFNIQVPAVPNSSLVPDRPKREIPSRKGETVDPIKSALRKKNAAANKAKKLQSKRKVTPE